MKNIDFKEKLSYFYPRDNCGININADRDWRVIIASFWLILLITISGSLYVIWQLKDASNTEVPFVKPITLKRELFDKATKDIDAKKMRFDELLLKKPEIKDPSI